jgi:hypothetical protein
MKDEGGPVRTAHFTNKAEQRRRCEFTGQVIAWVRQMCRPPAMRIPKNNQRRKGDMLPKKSLQEEGRPMASDKTVTQAVQHTHTPWMTLYEGAGVS